MAAVGTPATPHPPPSSFAGPGYLAVHVGKILCPAVSTLESPFFTFWVVNKGKVVEAKQYSPPVLFRQREYAWAGFTFWVQVRLHCGCAAVDVPLLCVHVFQPRPGY